MVCELISVNPTALATRAGIKVHKSLIKGQWFYQLIKLDFGMLKTIDYTKERKKKALEKG